MVCLSIIRYLTVEKKSFIVCGFFQSARVKNLQTKSAFSATYSALFSLVLRTVNYYLINRINFNCYHAVW